MSATFTADVLLTMAMQPTTTPSLRLLCLVAERADRAGKAVFADGELTELMGERRRREQATGDEVLGICQGLGYILPKSTVEKIYLNVDLIQPDGWPPEAGARYGELTLIHKVKNDATWLAQCACGSQRTYRLEYLTSGITAHCADSGFHRVAM